MAQTGQHGSTALPARVGDGVARAGRRLGGTGLLLFLPAAVLMSVTLVYPIASAILNSVTEDGAFVGLDHFRDTFADDVFWTSFKNNLILLASIPIRVGLGLVIAAILYRGIFGSRFYEVLIFIPFIPSIAAIGVLFIYLLNIDGPFNAFLTAVGLGAFVGGWLTDTDRAMWAIMGIVVWTRLGFTVLLFVARLLSVDRELFQAAFVDGASWYKTFRHVALPELRGTIQFVVVLSFIEAFSWSFAYVFVLGQGFNTSNYILEVYLYQKEFFAGQSGSAAAVAVILLVIASTLGIYRYRSIHLERLDEGGTAR